MIAQRFALISCYDNHASFDMMLYISLQYFEFREFHQDAIFFNIKNHIIPFPFIKKNIL